MSPARIGLGAFLAITCLSCVQSDLVAVERGDNGCTQPESCMCVTQICESLRDATRETFCAGQGFSVLSGDSCDLENGARSHRYALCSCTDYATSGALSVDAFASTPTDILPGVGSVGVNGNFNASSAPPRGVQIAGALEIAGENLSPPRTQLAAGAGVHPGVVPPCDCDSVELSAIDALVGDFQSSHDNQAIGLLPSALDGLSTDTDLTLPCGRFALTRIAAGGNLRLTIAGRTALFVAGNIEIDGAFEITFLPDAQLELFVAGNVRITGSALLGDPARGSDSLRLHIAGSGSLNIEGVSRIAGVVNAPRAELVLGQPLEVYGAMRVRRAAPNADLSIHYDADLRSAASCQSSMD